MADSKITALTSIGTSTDPANDPLVLVDVSDTSMAASGTTKKVTLNQLLATSPTATLASATITGDLTAARLNVTGSTIPANGVYLASGNNLTFAFNSTLGMSLNAGGLLVNNTTGFNSVANIKLKVGGRFLSGISGIGAYSFGTADAGGFVINDAGDGTTESRLLTLNSTGLGVGASPSTRLHISNSGDVYARIATTSVAKAGVQLSANGVVRSHLLYDDAAGTTYLSSGTGFGGSGQALVVQSGTSFQIYTNNQLATAQMTLDASGNLLVGTTNTNPAYNSVNGIALQPTFLSVSNTSGVAGAFNRNTDGIVLYFTRNGTAVGNVSVTTGGATFNSTSDYRLKESVAPMSGGLARVNALKPSIFKWKSDGSNGEGFIAHELAEVVPAAVNGEKDALNEDGTIKAQSIDMSRIVPILVAAIQELTAEVNALKNA